MDKYELKWDNFGESLIKGLGSEKSRGDFVDVCIAVSGGEVIHAHKVVLAVASTFFRDIFKATAHPYPLIYIQGVTLDDLNALMQYMYSGEVKLSEDRLESFLKAGNILGVKGLVSKSDEGGLGKRSTCDQEELGKSRREIEGRENAGGETAGGEKAERENAEVTSSGDAKSSERSSPIEILRGEELNKRLEKFYTNPEPEKFICEKCGKVIKSKRKTILHIERHMDLSFPCTLCSTVTHTRNALVEHGREKHNVKLGSGVIEKQP